MFGVCFDDFEKEERYVFPYHALSRETSMQVVACVVYATRRERVTVVFDDDSKAYLSEAHSCALLINPLPVLLLKYSYHKSYFLKLSPLQRKS